MAPTTLRNSSPLAVVVSTACQPLPVAFVAAVKDLERALKTDVWLLRAGPPSLLLGTTTGVRATA